MFNSTLVHGIESDFLEYQSTDVKLWQQRQTKRVLVERFSVLVCVYMQKYIKHETQQILNERKQVLCLFHVFAYKPNKPAESTWVSLFFVSIPKHSRSCGVDVDLQRSLTEHKKWKVIRFIMFETKSICHHQRMTINRSTTRHTAHKLTLTNEKSLAFVSLKIFSHTLLWIYNLHGSPLCACLSERAQASKNIFAKFFMFKRKKIFARNFHHRFSDSKWL